MDEQEGFAQSNEFKDIAAVMLAGTMEAAIKQKTQQ